MVMDAGDSSADDVAAGRAGLGAARFRGERMDDSSSEGASSCSEGGLPDEFGGTRVRKRRRIAREVREDVEVKEAPGGWERHTRGFGSKMMEKMGFTGRLGVRGDGIAIPIVARVRPAKLGLGAGGFSERTDTAAVEEEVRKRDGKTDAGEAEKRWKKKKRAPRGGAHGGVVVHERPKKRAIEEEREERVVDMRGRTSRVVSSVAAALASLDDEDTGADANVDTGNLFAAPEVLYNLRMLTDLARVDSETAERKLDTEKLIAENARSELARFEENADEARVQLSEVSILHAELDALSTATVANGRRASNDDYERAVRRFCTSPALRRDSRAGSARLGRMQGGTACERYGVPGAIVAAVEKHLSRQFAACLRVLDDLEECMALVKHCARILRYVQEPLGGRNEGELYLRLCCRVTMPRLRRFVGGSWDPCDPGNLVDVMQELHSVLPEALLGAFTETILEPRLSRQLALWTPSKGSRRKSLKIPPPHVWIHPWLPVFGRRALSTLLSQVRQSLISVLVGWKPCEGPDATPALIAPWKSVLSRTKVQVMLAKHVAGKLCNTIRAQCARKDLAAAIGADSGATVPTCIKQALQWQNVMSDAALCSLLSRALFPCLVDSFHGLLFHSAAAPSAITRAATHYKQWKRAIPQPLHQGVRGGLAAMLFLIHAAHTTHGTQRASLTNPTTLLNNAYSPAAAPRARPQPPPRRLATKQRATFKEALRSVGEQHALEFTPTAAAIDGLPVYRMGAVRVLLDPAKQVVFAEERGHGTGDRRGFRPVGIAELLRLAKA